MHGIRNIVARNLAALMSQHSHLNSQAKVAGQSDAVSSATVGRICRGEVDATIETIGALANVFQVPIGQFFVAETQLNGVAAASGPAPGLQPRLSPTLSALQVATVTTLVSMANKGLLSDKECALLLHQWADKL